MSKKLLICCHQTCPKQGATEVFEAFQNQVPQNIEVVASGCLGECGSGPMVLVLPEKIWYSQVQVRDVAAIVNRHLIGDRPVKHKLYQKFHPHQQRAIAAWIGVGVVSSLLFFFLWFLLSNTAYI